MLYISDKVRQKLALRRITEKELEECFLNWEYPTLLPIEDTRPEHLTEPPTWWMISETDQGRRLKVVFIKSKTTPIEIKSAWEASEKNEADLNNNPKGHSKNRHTANHMNQKQKHTQKGQLEDWEEDIGSSSKHAKPASLEDASALANAINQERGLQQISIRLQKSLIDDLKAMAKEEGIGYQPFLRQLVTKEITARKRLLAKDGKGRV